MITIQKAEPEHVEGIAKVCSDGYRATYQETHTQEYIERIISEFYNHERILKEIFERQPGWNGWFVALEEGIVVGAGGGGMTGPATGEVFVLYLDPQRRNEGIGTKLLATITEEQIRQGANEQWVSVSKGNDKGIPFYEARGFVKDSEKSSYGNSEGEDYTSLRYRRVL
ncbi:GNAT family N-acetyltransferase [Bacillus sp. V59.32b]|uniref:GNAT family N-acetyltransferase n=1 Tax=Bacillus sp. V59.32b TaxID=1758642 RepID=UPI000E3D7117|nr:GNAT family N-acetyltransferase [Bacillus sp. V59.32b]RFU66887.1 GNAT family N-acetyltransferase [Bacillus sp. V59.32b]